MDRLLLLLAAVMALTSPARVAAQLALEPAEEMVEKIDVIRSPYKEDKKGSDFLIVPTPQSSPILGSSATLMGAFFYNPKGEPEPWITGADYMQTSNGSSMLAIGHRIPTHFTSALEKYLKYIRNFS